MSLESLITGRLDVSGTLQNVDGADVLAEAVFSELVDFDLPNGLDERQGDRWWAAELDLVTSTPRFLDLFGHTSPAGGGSEPLFDSAGNPIEFAEVSMIYARHLGASDGRDVINITDPIEILNYGKPPIAGNEVQMFGGGLVAPFPARDFMNRSTTNKKILLPGQTFTFGSFAKPSLSTSGGWQNLRLEAVINAGQTDQGDPRILLFIAGRSA